MKDELFNSIKVLSYFLWEYTKYDNALRLWCCAEDIVCFLSENDIITKENFIGIISLDKREDAYKNFIRNIAYKIFCYTNDNSTDRNWFVAERFVRNYECIEACITASRIFGSVNKRDDIYKSIRSENARVYISDK